MSSQVQQDVETVYQMWKKYNCVIGSMTQLSDLMFNTVVYGKRCSTLKFYLNLRTVFQIIPDLIPNKLFLYLNSLEQINDPYNYLEKDTLIQTYKTHLARLAEIVVKIGNWPVEQVAASNTNAEGEWEDLTKRLRSGATY
jgi:hypothetical protein